jgi:ribosomal protein L11 methyltransferase
LEWTEVSVQVEAETAEAVAEVLSRFVRNGVVIEAGPDGATTGPVSVRAYVPQDDRAVGVQRSIREALWHLGQIRPIPEPVFAQIPETDWTLAWREKLHTMHIGQRIVVRPSWRAYEPAPGEVVITLDPGQAFGTGAHPTTQLCLQALEDLVWPGCSVLDLGTGSGILAIAAAKLGAASVVGVDTDPVAVEAAGANVSANLAAPAVTVARGSLAQVAGTYDVVVVNILLGAILTLLQDGLASHANPGGHVVLAGILVDQADVVVDAATSVGLIPAGHRASGDWVGLVFKRSWSS